jgi:hypothetical protein
MCSDYVKLKDNPGEEDCSDNRRDSIIANQVYRAMNIRERWQVCPLCDGEGCGECDFAGYIHPDDLREFEEWCTRHERPGFDRDLEEWEKERG